MINYQKRSEINPFLGILFVLSTFVLNQSTAQTYVEKTKQIAQKHKIPAIQVLHYKNGKSTAVNYGLKQNGAIDSIDQKTVFQAASLTKVVTAYVFFRLMDKGIIELDIPLWNYYQYDRLNNHPEKDKITARMVLSHRTGLMNWQGDVPSLEWRKTALTMQFKPGTAYMYSGEGFYFLQETMEHITGKTFQELIETEVLAPMKMNNSEIRWTSRLENNAAWGHKSLGKSARLAKYLNTNAAYTLYTTAEDYGKFISKFIFEGYNLKPSTHRLVLKKIALAKKSDQNSRLDKYVPVTLGMRMQLNELGTAYWHTGSNPGFRGMFIAYPASQEYLVFFSNSEDGFHAIPDILALFLNNNQTFWSYKWSQGELD